MQGKIIKGIAGFYYVKAVGSGIYECKAKGIFRKEKIKPLVGDNVEIEVLSEEEKLGNVVDILPRKNELIRPAVGQCGSGTGHICCQGAETKLLFAGPLFGYHGAPGNSRGHLF